MVEKNEIQEKVVLAHADATFFQSEMFAEFQRQIPYRGKAWMLVDEMAEKGAAAGQGESARCLVIKQKLPLGYCWLWVPYGPLIGAPDSDQRTGEARRTSTRASTRTGPEIDLIQENDMCVNGADEALTRIFSEIEKIAREEKAIYVRVEPPIGWSEDFIKKLAEKWRVKKSKKRYTPECTLIVDLEPEEKQILAQMKPKGRYNINVAQKHGVEVTTSKNPANLRAFYEILQKTGGRDGFGIHPFFFYEKLLATFGTKNAGELFVAKYKGKVIAGSIVIYYKDTATYYYGASDYEHRAFMAPYVVQWEAMREAKRRGMKFYDFLGIAPADGRKNHPWAGVTEFKKKFGGREIQFPDAFEIVFKPVHCALLRWLR